MNFDAIYFEDAHITDLPNLATVKQLDLACPLIENVAERNAISPLLDFSRFGPELEVDGLSILRSVVIWIDCAMIMCLGHGLVISDE